MEHILDLTKQRVTELIASLQKKGQPEIKADQLFRELYKAQTLNPTHWDGVSLKLIKHLQESYDFSPLEIDEVSVSEFDASAKFIFKLQCGLLVESVLIPEKSHFTLCVSSQVGCAQGCTFCQTGRMGLKKSLSTAEIVGQLFQAQIWLNENKDLYEKTHKLFQISNIVFMGMGEPLDNLDNVLSSIEIFTDSKGFNLSPNKITVSTVGLLPQLERFLNERPSCLALSLHSPFEEQRSRVMPVNKRSPLPKVLKAMRRLQPHFNRPYMIQYTLLRGVNDSIEHAEELVKLLSDMKVKINLIPLNEHEGAAFRRPDLNNIYQFQQYLKEKGFVTTVRLSKGRDIEAACGQLIKKKLDAKKKTVTEEV